VDVIRSEMFTSEFGFIVDYLAEILRNLRQEDFSNRAREHFDFGNGISERDETAVSKTVSGLLKLIFPNRGETPDEVEELLWLAMECRKRVKDQLFRIDPTYPPVEFYFGGSDGQKTYIRTVEEDEFPQFYNLNPAQEVKEKTSSGETKDSVEIESEDANTVKVSGNSPVVAEPIPEEGHYVFTENRKGVSYDSLFGPYIDGASRIIITDPYIRIFYQTRNMMEFVEMVIKRKALEDQVSVHLVTGADEENAPKQRELLDSIAEACIGTGVEFTWAFDNSGSGHARDIVTDNGWKIVLDRGLDIFQPPVKRDGFTLGDRLQEHRMVKNFYVTYVSDINR
jgi:ATP-dependent Lon protease